MKNINNIVVVILNNNYFTNNKYNLMIPMIKF